MEINPDNLDFNKYNETGDWIPPEIIGPWILPSINAAVAEFIQTLRGGKSDLTDIDYLIGSLRIKDGEAIILLTLKVEGVKIKTEEKEGEQK